MIFIPEGFCSRLPGGHPLVVVPTTRLLPQAEGGSHAITTTEKHEFLGVQMGFLNSQGDTMIACIHDCHGWFKQMQWWLPKIGMHSAQQVRLPSHLGAMLEMDYLPFRLSESPPSWHCDLQWTLLHGHLWHGEQLPILAVPLSFWGAVAASRLADESRPSRRR